MDLAEVMNEHYGKNNKIKIVGTRPGEKIHECMINKIESQRTFEFEDHYVILPQICNSDFGKEYPYLKGLKKVSFQDYCSNNHLVDKVRSTLHSFTYCFFFIFGRNNSRDPCGAIFV